MMQLRRYADTAREVVGMAEDLAELAGAELQNEFKTRVLYVAGLAVAVLLGVIALFFVGIMLVVIAWDTDYRTAMAVGWTLFLALATVVIGLTVIRRWRSEVWMPETRSEVRETYRWLKTRI